MNLRHPLVITMSFKWLSILTAAIIIIGIIVGLGLNNKGGSDPVEDDFVDEDASQMAASFSSNYSGFFGRNYYLIDSVAEGVGTANYPNGQEGRTHNYVTFIVEDSKEKARSEFNSLKNMNSKQEGQAVSIKGGFDDAAGVYNNANGSGYLFYTGYLNNAFFESYAYVEGKTITEDAIATFVADVHYAFTHPVPVDQAKRHTETKYPITVDSADNTNTMFSQTITKEPRRIVTYMPQTAELMCLFGLEDRVVIAVAAGPDDVCLNSDVQTAYSEMAKKVGADNLPSKEQLIAAQPDIIIGWHSIFNYAGDVSEWNSRGVNYYVVNRPASQLSDYTDMIADIGLIFNKQDRAKQIIDEFNAGVEKAKQKTQTLSEDDKRTGMFIEARADGTYNLYGSSGASSLTGNLIVAAGGKNIIPETKAKVSPEEVDVLKPEFIFLLVNTSVGTDSELQAAKNAFMATPALAALVDQATAVVPFKLNDVFDGGVLPTDIVERLYDVMYA